MRPTTRRAGRQRERAFTLVEMLAVIAVIAILAGMLALASGPLIRGTKLESSANKLQAVLRQARGEALARGVPVSVVFNNGSTGGIAAANDVLRAGTGGAAVDFTAGGSFWDGRIDDDELVDIGAVGAYDDVYDLVLNVSGSSDGFGLFEGRELTTAPTGTLGVPPQSLATSNNLLPVARPRGDLQFYCVVAHHPDAAGTVNTWDVFRCPAPIPSGLGALGCYQDLSLAASGTPAQIARARREFTFNRSFTPSMIGPKRLLESGVMFMSFGAARVNRDGAMAGDPVDGCSWDDLVAWPNAANATMYYPRYFWGDMTLGGVNSVAGRGANAYLGNARVTFLPSGRAVGYAANRKCERLPDDPVTADKATNDGYWLTHTGWYLIGLCLAPPDAENGQLAAPAEHWEHRTAVGVHDMTGRVEIRRNWAVNEL